MPAKSRSRPRPNPASAPPEPAVPSNRAWVFALACGLIPALLALIRFPGINGPWYWPWRYVDNDPTLFLALAGAAGVAVCWAASQAKKPAPALATLVVVHWTLLFGFLALSSNGLATLGERIEHPDITSYFTEAARIDDVGQFLDEYDQRLPRMIGHTQTHPPGPILYYRFFLAIFGEESAAQAGGVVLGLLGGLSVVLAYLLGLRLASASAGLAAAAVWAILPGAVILLGSFDALYPVFTLALVLLWSRALEGSFPDAVLFSAVLVAALFFTHSFWTLGTAFLVMGLAPRFFGDERALARFLKAGAVAAVVMAALFGLLHVLFGYDHLAALQTSMRIQDRLAGVWNRPWSSTVVWDVYDFFLASGWAPFAVLLLFWKRGLAGQTPRLKSFAVAAVATLAVVDLSGLLRAETARVWMFLQPFAILLVAVELARWSEGRRNALFAVLLFALAAIRARMAFI